MFSGLHHVRGRLLVNIVAGHSVPEHATTRFCDHEKFNRCFCGVNSPVSRRRCLIRSTQARLTAYFAATSLDGRPASESRSTRVRKSIEYGAMASPAAEVP